MIPLSDFLTEVRPYAPGVPDQVAYKHLRNAAIDFCERTRLWKWEDDYDVVETFVGEPIITPAGSTVFDIERVSFDGRDLRPVSTVDLDRLSPHWRTSQETGMPEFITQIEQNTLRVVPAQAGHIYLCLRLKPSKDAMELPDFLDTEYRECIGWGALGRILTIPGQSYTSPDMAQFYMQRFENKIGSLSAKGSKGQQNAPKRTRSRFF